MDLQSDLTLETLLARFERSNPEALLGSIAAELVRLYRLNAALTARVAAMEALQVTIDRIAADAPEMLHAELPNSVAIDATYSLPGALGFHEIEYGENGKAYRWTGPERQFAFELFVDRSEPLKFVLQFGRIYADVSPELIRCSADSKDVAVKLIHNGQAFQLHGALAPRRDRGGTLLSFTCPAMLSPFEAGTSSDERRLGIAFEWLNLDPQPAEAADAPPAPLPAAPLPEPAPMPRLQEPVAPAAAGATAPPALDAAAEESEFAAALRAFPEVDETVPPTLHERPAPRLRRAGRTGERKRDEGDVAA